ncbi:MAG TPA: capsular biosynthesis protein [Polyangiaceae bacterium]|nr:capsular biosynthesis protein [Polyangiaceae bacterium]
MAELSGRHLLLLQGPAGPFFARVAEQLRQAGASITKVNFNGGEDLYYRGPEVVRFRGALAEWPAFFEQLVQERSVSGVVLFGDCRPLHRLAIERARQLGIEVFVFEEGYLRPDFVTLERGGVNGHSQIPRDPTFYAAVQPEREPPREPIKHAFIKSALHTICYASAAALLRKRYPEYRHHRDIRPLSQAGLWFRGTLRRALHTLRDRELSQKLETGELGPYFFVPLQVHLDSQLSHSRYATITEFIREVVAEFARHAPADHRLILKLHPMDRPYSDYSVDIEALRLEHGLGERLIYTDVINLPAALRHARGTVVINSTVGLSSLTHGTPVKCLGYAVYDMPGLTHQGSLADFFRNPEPVDRALYKRFRHWLLAQNQLNGSVWSRLHDDPTRLMR